MKVTVIFMLRKNSASPCVSSRYPDDVDGDARAVEALRKELRDVLERSDLGRLSSGVGAADDDRRAAGHGHQLEVLERLLATGGRRPLGG